MKKLVIIALFIPNLCFGLGTISTTTQRYIIHGKMPELFLVDTFTGKTWLFMKSHWAPIAYQCSEKQYDRDPDCENSVTVDLQSGKDQ